MGKVSSVIKTIGSVLFYSVVFTGITIYHSVRKILTGSIPIKLIIMGIYASLFGLFFFRPLGFWIVTGILLFFELMIAVWFTKDRLHENKLNENVDESNMFF